MWALAAVAATMVVLTFGLGVVIALVASERPHVPIAVICGLLLVGLLVLIVLSMLGNSFAVTTRGIRLRTFGVPTFVPWVDVAAIEIEQRRNQRGATVVRRADGQRFRSAITGARYALRRGESTLDHGHDLLQPARPTRAAIDAHRRYLAGEFGPR